jgi:hypothetical protein
VANPSEGRRRAPREETWKRLWAAPIELNDAATEATFEELTEALVPGHMQGRFVKRFGVPRERFGNRFFVEGAVFRDWSTRLTELGVAGSHVEVDVVTASGDELRGYRLRGQSRRTLKDVVIDDSEAVCAIVRDSQVTLYILTEPGMRGAIVLVADDHSDQAP